MYRSILRLALPMLFAAVPLAAQPERPELPRGADPNDWQAYFDYGASIIATRSHTADAAFYWASRLDPSRSEPLYARWASFHASDLGRFERYLQDEERILRRPDVVAADSLRTLALMRNPFVHRGLYVAVVDLLPGRWRSDLHTTGWLQYGQGKLDQAARTFGRLVERSPERNWRHRYERALVFTAMARFDSATVEMQTVLEALRHQDDTRLMASYESKEFFEYGIGLLKVAQNDLRGARAALERALVENAAFYPARAGLGLVSLAEGKTAAAVDEYQQATEISGDPVIRFEYGKALAAAGRPDDAAEQLRAVTQAERYWADPYLHLGVAYERLGRRKEALDAYTTYVERAPRRDAAVIQRARARIAALQASAAAP